MKKKIIIVLTVFSLLAFATGAYLIFAICGVSWVRNSFYADAVTFLSDAALKSPNKARVHDNLGLVLKERGRISDALHEFERAVELNPHSVYALNNLATVYCGVGRREECAALFQKAISIKPDYIEPRYNLGMYYYEAGLLDEALQEYKAIIQIDPYSKEAAFARPMITLIQNQMPDRSRLKNQSHDRSIH